MNSLIQNFIGFEGRINRQKWWIGVLVLIVVTLALYFILGAVMGMGIPTLEQMADPAYMASMAQRAAWQSLIISLIVTYPYLGLSVKRRHDRDNNGYDAIGLIVFNLVWSVVQGLGLLPAGNPIVMVISVIFLIYAIYILVQLGFLKGTSGPNSYGPDPLQG